MVVLVGGAFSYERGTPVNQVAEEKKAMRERQQLEVLQEELKKLEDLWGEVEGEEAMGEEEMRARRLSLSSFDDEDSEGVGVWVLRDEDDGTVSEEEILE